MGQMKLELENHQHGPVRGRQDGGGIIEVKQPGYDTLKQQNQNDVIVHVHVPLILVS